MGKVFLGICVAVASLVLADSLVCNSCSLSLAGICLNSGTLTCSTNTSVCFTATVSFPSVPAFSGFSSSGCREPAGCNMTTNSTLLGANLNTEARCCSTDRCNGASSIKMSLTAAVGAALLASVWGSLL